MSPDDVSYRLPWLSLSRPLPLQARTYSLWQNPWIRTGSLFAVTPTSTAANQTRRRTRTSSEKTKTKLEQIRWQTSWAALARRWVSNLRRTWEAWEDSSMGRLASPTRRTDERWRTASRNLRKKTRKYEKAARRSQANQPVPLLPRRRPVLLLPTVHLVAHLSRDKQERGKTRVTGLWTTGSTAQTSN